MLPEQRPHAGEGAFKERSGTLVGHDRPHLTRQLPEVTGKEVLVLPIEAGGCEEAHAVEIGADPHLDPFHMVHQHEADAGAIHLAELRRHHGADVAPVREAAHVGVRRAEAVAVEFQDVSSGAAGEKRVDFGQCGELPHGSDLQAELLEHFLRIGPVVLEPVAERAAADHVEAVRPKRVLTRTAGVGDVLEEHDAVLSGFAHPGQLGFPIVGARNHPGQGTVALWLGHEDANVVPLRGEPKVEGAEVAIVADAEKPHEHLPIRS